MDDELLTMEPPAVAHELQQYAAGGKWAQRYMMQGIHDRAIHLARCVLGMEGEGESLGYKVIVYPKMQQVYYGKVLNTLENLGYLTTCVPHGGDEYRATVRYPVQYIPKNRLFNAKTTK